MHPQRLIEKNSAHVSKFLIAFRKGRRDLLLAFGFPLLLAMTDKLLGLKLPDFVVVTIGVFSSIKLLQWIYIFWLGDARCPQCGSVPIANEKLFGIGPAIGFGIPLFEWQISRCRKCDYPLSFPELEKDLSGKVAE